MSGGIEQAYGWLVYTGIAMAKELLRHLPTAMEGDRQGRHGLAMVSAGLSPGKVQPYIGKYHGTHIEPYTQVEPFPWRDGKQKGRGELRTATAPS